jgi:ring-1,2-phenylacetyl-CoA epoxidase subunit PaaB
MSPHGNPEVPASSATEINRDAAKVSPAVEPAETKTPAVQPAGTPAATTPEGGNAWGLWEVFVRSSRGLSHVHAGSLHAPDAAMALRNARDLYTRRNEGVSIWVVPSTAITASSPDEKDSFFEPAGDKPYRHPTFYEIPEGVKHL